MWYELNTVSVVCVFAKSQVNNWNCTARALDRPVGGTGGPNIVTHL